MAYSARIVAAVGLGVLVAAACGGESMTASDDGDAAASGDAGTGGSGRGGSANGGTANGGTANGGTAGVGAGPTGGVAGTPVTGGSGGTNNGGTSSGTGGVAAGGSGGAAGAGGICSLPLESGPCDAYIPSYGFSASGYCQSFIYGGCGGNENRFSTLAECEAACGGTLSRCPDRMPNGLSCSREGDICPYDVEGCPCSPTLPGHCVKLDPECRTIFPDAGVSEIVIAGYWVCNCANGAWNCTVAGGGR